MVEHESEWTQRDQDQVLGLAEWKRRLCRCGCGHLSRHTQRPTDDQHPPSWDVHEVRCTARASSDIVARDRRMALTPHDQWPKSYRPGTVQAGDGVLFWTTPVDGPVDPTTERSEPA